eukprot:CAMPEP_0171242624 /NCGR_PEP_ID=MMETSP0790-20130122/45808_1 /TAXON_ID=2925 /ORGANISM="Alexandrium catenella, Strain OF101" /LENGTH=56 /DNA_ID=CAMNT_0011709473 /DNA_START=16 /DNA_END=186 /DNA_ORIENTATION=-
MRKADRPMVALPGRGPREAQKPSGCPPVGHTAASHAQVHVRAPPPPSRQWAARMGP